MAGRPTLLTQEMVDKASSYLSTCVNVLPTIEGLALYLEVSKVSIYSWCDEDNDLGEQFLNVFEKIKNEQGVRLVNGGLYGRFNSTITKLMLSKHGYVEKQETDLTTNGKDLPTPILGGSSVHRDNSD